MVLAVPAGVSATNGGYRIEVELQNYPGDTLKLGYYFGKSQYLRDTAILSKGRFVFQGDEALKPGVYLLVMPPDNKFIQLLVAENEQHFSLSLDILDIVRSAKFKGSEENELYYSYLRQLDEFRPRAEELKKRIAEDSLQTEAYTSELARIDQDVKSYQQDLIRKHSSSMTAMLVKASQEIDTPPFDELPEEERKLKQFDYYRAHYFDQFDLRDPRAIRSGVIHQKIDFFLQKLSYQYPDSQSVAMDYLLKKMDPEGEAFQYYLVHFLNESARSKRMGMDAAYVYLVDHYYAKGKATWMDKEQLDKLITQAETLRPILIGKIAPDLPFYKESGEKINIHDIRSDYTVLFFWDPECGHCKKSLPHIIDFYSAYKDKGVEILAICTKTGADISSCWNMIQEKGMDIWVNAADQYLRNRYKTIYDIKTTPQIFILDQKKKILVKKIAGEDLTAVMEEILKVNQNE